MTSYDAAARMKSIWMGCCSGVYWRLFLVIIVGVPCKDGFDLKDPCQNSPSYKGQDSKKHTIGSVTSQMWIIGDHCLAIVQCDSGEKCDVIGD